MDLSAHLTCAFHTRRQGESWLWHGKGVPTGIPPHPPPGVVVTDPLLGVSAILTEPKASSGLPCFSKAGITIYPPSLLPILHNHSYEGYEESVFHCLAIILYLLHLGNGEISLYPSSRDSNLCHWIAKRVL